ncbi:CoA transferase, partial [Rhizobiaceae sp. 2RAB30]
VLHDLLAEAVAKVTVAECIERCAKAGVPCGPINDIAQVFEDEHVKARGLAVTLRHPVYGQIPSVANPVKFSGAASTSEHAPPMLGEHSAQILGALERADRWPVRQEG